MRMLRFLGCLALMEVVWAVHCSCRGAQCRSWTQV